jgi:hypothetical protein
MDAPLVRRRRRRSSRTRPRVESTRSSSVCASAYRPAFRKSMMPSGPLDKVESAGASCATVALAPRNESTTTCTTGSFAFAAASAVGAPTCAYSSTRL